MLEIRDLTIQYEGQPPVLEHFNLSMKKGKSSVLQEKAAVERPRLSGLFWALWQAAGKLQRVKSCSLANP